MILVLSLNHLISNYFNFWYKESYAVNVDIFFDSICNKFVALNSNPLCYNKALAIGNKSFIFQNKVSSTYDVDKDEWEEKPCEAMKDLFFYSSVKLPFN